MMWEVTDQYEASQLWGCRAVKDSKFCRLVKLCLDTAAFGAADPATTGERILGLTAAMRASDLVVDAQMQLMPPSERQERVEEILELFQARKPFSSDLFALALRSNPSAISQMLFKEMDGCLNPDYLLTPKNWHWFNTYVLKLHVWTRESAAEGFFFRHLLRLAKEKMTEEEAQMNRVIESVCREPDYLALIMIANEDQIVRQDDPKVGLVADDWAIAALTNTGGKTDAKQEISEADELVRNYCLDVYLNKLLFLARLVNDPFQAWVKGWVAQFQKENPDFGVEHKPAPVKKAPRCRAKVTDFGLS